MASGSRGYDSKGHFKEWYRLGIDFIVRERISAYFRRWSIEEAYRFEKQGFGIEKATVRKFPRIQTLVGLSLLSFLVLVRISERERLKTVVIQSAAMEKVKKKDRPRFMYYQLLKGLQRMFRGIGRVFRFRSTEISRCKDRWEAIQRPLFDWPSSFLEMA